MNENNKKENNESPDKLIMIVNGQPIEMCPRTLSLCNKRAQRMMGALKAQSLANVKTLRFFWGDVVMLNILTNQLLQKVDPRSLSRVLKPTNSLQEDLDEYRASHKDKIIKMRDALIIANDSTLPLDYSRELEKYYKKVEEDTPDLSIDTLIKPESTNSEDAQQDSDNKQLTVDIGDAKITNVVVPTFKDNDENEIDVAALFQSPASTADVESINLPHIEESEKKPTPCSNKEGEALAEMSPKNNEEKPESKDELSQHQQSFASYSSIDLDSLFS